MIRKSSSRKVVIKKAGASKKTNTTATRNYKSTDKPTKILKRTSQSGKYFDHSAKTIEIKQPKNISSAKKAGNPDLIRLNKYISNSGICSRREADEYIKTGLVKVNDEVVTELGTKIKPTDSIKFNDSLIKSEKKVYIVLNKPKDYICTNDDPHAKKTVLDLVKNACPQRVYPVGRLDRNTTGVLLLTNDGELTKKLTHPKFEKKKIYYAHIDRSLSKNDMDKIANGLDLEDGFIKVDAIAYVDKTDKKQIGVELHSGKNHIIKRIFEKLDYQVVKLDRVYFAGMTKKNLKRGQWRFLTEKEVGMIQMGAFE
jgi:23S rRNA pseudouridine2605 synthase